MKLTFFDMQDQSNLTNGAEISDTKSLSNFLDELKVRQPFFAENGFELTVGIGGEFGCVQHSRSDGAPPYLMALGIPSNARNCFAEVSNLHERFYEFLAGGTNTEVPMRYILPFNDVKAIVLHFHETGQRSLAFSWKEI
jgi:hypothetical protein